MQPERQYILLAFTWLLAACATRPHQPFALSTPPQDQARLYVYRETSALALRDATVLVDGNQISELGSHEYVSTLLAPGFHTVTAKWASDLHLGPVSAVVESAPKQVIFLKLVVGASGTTSLGPYVPVFPTMGTALETRPPPDAMRELACCSPHAGTP